MICFRRTAAAALWGDWKAQGWMEAGRPGRSTNSRWGRDAVAW